MRIGEVAKRTGLSPDAVRFYERRALLPRLPRTAGGFRLYGESEIDTLGFIRRAQSLGFTLAEIRELLSLRRSHVQPCATVERRLRRKLAGIREKIGHLRRLERDLALALQACGREQQRPSDRCPLLRPAAKTKRKARPSAAR
jgi:DNA-binding transcriptional MerR regulator